MALGAVKAISNAPTSVQKEFKSPSTFWKLNVKFSTTCTLESNSIQASISSMNKYSETWAGGKGKGCRFDSD